MLAGSTARRDGRPDLARRRRQDPAGRGGRRPTASCAPSCAGWSAGTPRRRRSARPTAAGRTVPDLPADRRAAARPGARPTWSPRSWACPATRPTVAAAVLGGRVRRLDLLRNDGGSVTLDGCCSAASTTAAGRCTGAGRVEVDDAVLTDGEEPVLACAVAQRRRVRDAGRAAAAGRRRPGRRPGRRGGRGAGGRTGRCCARPACGSRCAGPGAARWRSPRATTSFHFVDDGVAGELTRKRSWWIEPGAWAVYVA